MNRCLLAVLSGLFIMSSVQAECAPKNNKKETDIPEIELAPVQAKKLFLTVYSQNLAQVKTIYSTKLPSGISLLAFEGVSEQLQPQTTLIEGKDLSVLEKIYEYNLLTRENLLDAYVGRDVITVTEDEKSGTEYLDDARLLSVSYGTPVLKFDYGVDPSYPGRIVFKDVPDNLRTKPTVTARVETEKAGLRDLSFDYLTGGMSWSANYVAEVGHNDQLSLQAWVEISNQSGTDYKNAAVTLIAGDVKNINMPLQPRPLMLSTARSAKAEADAVHSTQIAAQSLGEYYRYELPRQTDILDKQNKQISLWRADAVKYEKKFKLVSPLNTYRKMFERQHATIVYKLNNRTENGLGQPMPQGQIRFYQKNDQRSATFIGAANMPRLAKGETAELAVGESFDIYATGKMTSLKKIADKTNEMSYEIDFFNASDKDAEVVWEQPFDGETEVVDENASVTGANAGELTWTVKVPAGGTSSLTYKLRTTRN